MGVMGVMASWPLGAIISSRASVPGTQCNLQRVQMQRFGEENGAFGWCAGQSRRGVVDESSIR
jgi:hypothetical protein